MATPLLLSDVVELLEKWFPVRLAEHWDNVGLLIGHQQQTVRRIMTCLTVMPETCLEAIEQKANLIIAHHPFPFRPLKRITTETAEGTMLLDLIRAGVAVYSPHTSYDSAATGINQQIAEMLALDEIRPLYDFCPEKTEGATAVSPDEGMGRIGTLTSEVKLAELIEKVGRLLVLKTVHYVGDLQKMVRRVAIGCGSAGEFLQQAATKKADVFLVGEAKYHQFLEAQSCQIALIVPGHYATERFAVETLATRISNQLSCRDECHVWASQQETDPLNGYGIEPVSPLGHL